MVSNRGRRPGAAAALAAAMIYALAGWGSGCGDEPREPAKGPTPKRAAPESRTADAPPSPNPDASASRAPLEPVDPAEWNVLLITLDTLRADALGAYASGSDATPHLDRMATEGVLFEQVAAANPSTLPSHATLFTGRHPYAHGVRANAGYALSEQNPTLASELARAGWYTGAEVAATVMRASTQITRGFEHVRNAESEDVELEQLETRNGRKAVDHVARTGRDISKRGIEFLRANRHRRFFLWLHYFDAHNPYTPPSEFRKRYPDDPYRGEVAHVDAQVGKVVDAIRRLGLRNRTLVVVTSDHGEGLGEHGEPSHSFFVYETTMRIPLIFWGPPQLPHGARIGSPVRAADVAPTILDLLGQPALEGVQGVSLRPLLEDPEGSLDLIGYGESVGLLQIFNDPPLRSVREGRWKYIHKVNPELYDLAADPSELRNLAAREPEVAQRLRGHLETLLSGPYEAPADTRIGVSAEALSQLAALGYATAPVSEIGDEVGSLALRGSDVATRTGDLEAMSLAQGNIATKQWEAAEAGLRDLHARHPESAHLSGLYARSLEGLGRDEEAIVVFEAAHRLAPAETDHAVRLATLLVKLDRRDDAVQVCRAHLAQAPCSSVRLKVNDLLHEQKRYAEQLRNLEEGAERCPDAARVVNNYAWTLATLPDDALRDGALAVKIARQAIQVLGADPGPEYLDTLAAAHAEAGDFEAARREQAAAIAKLRAMGVSPAVMQGFEARLAGYEAGRPTRD